MVKRWAVTMDDGRVFYVYTKSKQTARVMVSDISQAAVLDIAQCGHVTDGKITMTSHVGKVIYER